MQKTGRFLVRLSVGIIDFLLDRNSTQGVRRPKDLAQAKFTFSKSECINFLVYTSAAEGSRLRQRLGVSRISFALAVLATAWIFNGYPVQAATDQKIIINKATNQLFYYEDGSLSRTFPVGTGREESLTPEGDFTVASKLVNPYYRRGGIPGGDPRNPLGVRWLGLSVRNTGGSIYGIHGNNNPSSIGKYVSAGCIRMYNEDVIWLYDRIPLGTPVSIFNRRDQKDDLPELEQIQVTVDDQKLRQGFLVDGISFAGLRELSEALEAEVLWDNAQKEACVLTPGEKIRVNARGEIYVGNEMLADWKGIFRNNTLYVPIRFLVGILDAELAWDAVNRAVTVQQHVV